MLDKIRILVGYDESPQSKNAVKEAITIARCFSGFVKAVYVYGKGMEGKAEMAVIEIEEKLKEAKVEHDVSLVLGSNPAKALLTIAKQENFALIVVGSRGLGNTLSMLLGSVSKQIVGDAHCNVLVVKEPQLEQVGSVAGSEGRIPALFNTRIGFKHGLRWRCRN